MGFGQETPPSSIQLGSHRHSQYNDILYSALNAHSDKNYVIQYTTDKGGTLSNEINSHDDAESVVLETHERKRAVKLTSEMAEGGSSEGITKTDNDEDIKAEMIKRLDEIKPSLESLDDIPLVFRDSPIKCLKSSTQEQICFYLDPPTDIPADGDEGRHLPKDYRGLSEWVGQEQAFVKYLTKCMSNWKTSEVIGKWITSEGEPKPTLGNFRECMIGPGGIDRPDIITDLAPIICKDAFEWESTKYEANTTPPIKEDTSWQLTRHDVVTGQRTYYTCCLVYADEDEGMAQIITKLYKTVRQDAMFFLPQFDLKRGKYIYETTANVIEERCDGKVIFIISEYFFASPVCQFAVNFSRSLDAASDQRKLIPFHLTTKYDHVPRVLKGISGVKWFRKNSRETNLLMLTDTLLGGKVKEEKLEELKKRMSEVIFGNRELYLCDPPYDSDTPQPGEPISVYDPPFESANSDDPSANEFQPAESDFLISSVLDTLQPSRLKRIKNYFKKFKKVGKMFKSTSDESFWSASTRRRSDMFFEEDPRNEIIYSRTDTGLPSSTAVKEHRRSYSEGSGLDIECSPHTAESNAIECCPHTAESNVDTSCSTEVNVISKSKSNTKLEKTMEATVEVVDVDIHSDGHIEKHVLLQYDTEQQDANETKHESQNENGRENAHHNMAFRDSSENEGTSPQTDKVVSTENDKSELHVNTDD